LGLTKTLIQLFDVVSGFLLLDLLLGLTERKRRHGDAQKGEGKIRFVAPS
jgi:hypothetical protein